MIPVRLSLTDGQVLWRMLPDLEHGSMCRAFSLDPVSTGFDLPRTARGPGSKARVSGYVTRHGRQIGVVHVAREGERFRDLDPTNARDRLTLDQTR